MKKKRYEAIKHLEIFILKTKLLIRKFFAATGLILTNAGLLLQPCMIKKGIDLAGVGSNKIKACILGAGTEHHILEKARIINLKTPWI